MTSYASLKKARDARKSKRRAPNSTLPAVAPKNQSRKKKLGGPRRKQLPARKRKPIPKVNPVALQRRRDRYRKKLAAYRRSDCHTCVEARALDQCEHQFAAPSESSEQWTRALGVWLLAKPTRCQIRRPSRLTHHHKTYARFGGNEKPEDVIVLCDRHNAEAEAKHPTRRRDYRRTTA